MFCPPPLRVRVRIVPKLGPTLNLVRPLVRVIAIGWGRRATLVRHILAFTRARTRGPDGRRALHHPPHLLPNLIQRQLHRCFHLPIPLLLLRPIGQMKDVLIQPGGRLGGRGTVIPNTFVRAQERRNLRVGREAGEEVAEHGGVFDLTHG